MTKKVSKTNQSEEIYTVMIDGTPTPVSATSIEEAVERAKSQPSVNKTGVGDVS